MRQNVSPWTFCRFFYRAAFNASGVDFCYCFDVKKRLSSVAAGGFLRVKIYDAFESISRADERAPAPRLQI